MLPFRWVLQSTQSSFLPELQHLKLALAFLHQAVAMPARICPSDGLLGKAFVLIRKSVSFSTLLKGCCEWLSPLMARSSRCCVSEKERAGERSPWCTNQQPSGLWSVSGCRCSSGIAGQGFLCWERVCSSLSVWGAPAPAAGGAGWGVRPALPRAPRQAGRHPEPCGKGENGTLKARSLPCFGGGGSQGST